MSDPPVSGIEAAGTRSVAAGQIGIAATGDQSTIDARTTNLAPGAIPDPANVAAPPGTHNLPRPPARVFVGRDTALARLRGALAQDSTAVVTQAVYGLGGIGKSELALHHAHACRAEYQLMWWITADDQTQLQTGLAALAARLCPVLAMAGTTLEAAGWAVAWLQTHDRWLLILDNVSEPDDVQPLLGQLTSGHLLLTTRRDTGWDQLADPIQLDVLDPGPAAELLTVRTMPRQADPDDSIAAIAVELGCLPLALDQAAAYIAQTRITPALYRQRLQQHPAVMYASAGGQTQRTISRVWDITIEAITARNPAAVKLLHILACYAPDRVPRIMLGNDDQLAVDEALATLASYSMITLTPDTVSMHRLVQAVIASRPPSDEESAAFGGQPPETTALAWLNRTIPAEPDTNLAGWPLLRALVPHVAQLSGQFPPEDQPERLGRAQNEIALFHKSQGEYRQALELRQSTLAIIEKNLGPDHPSTAVALNNLAATHWDLGQPGKALPLEQRALAITEKALGPDHPSTAIRLNNLALTYSDLGQPGKALPLQQRALAITEKTLGPDHPDTATRLNNLAVTHCDLGQPGTALPLQQRALAITEKALGPDHPDAATRLGNLAATHCDLGQPGKALPLQQRALAITEMTLGPDHPDTAIRLNNLAVIYQALGQPEKTVPLQRRAQTITEKAKR